MTTISCKVTLRERALRNGGRVSVGYSRGNDYTFVRLTCPEGVVTQFCLSSEAASELAVMLNEGRKAVLEPLVCWVVIEAGHE